MKALNLLKKYLHPILQKKFPKFTFCQPLRRVKTPWLLY